MLELEQYRKLHAMLQSQDKKEVFVDIALASRRKAGLGSERSLVDFKPAKLSPE